MTADNAHSPAQNAPSGAPRPGVALPPPIEELNYEAVGPVRRWLYRFLLVVVFAGGGGALVYYITGPHVPADSIALAREFAAALNAKDYHKQYALLAPAEPVGPQGADIPLLDEEKLKIQLTGAVEPSFFSGFTLKMDFSERRFSTRGKHRIWQFAVPIEDFGTAPRPVAGQRPGYLFIAVDVTQRPFRVFAFATYTSFYFNNYPMETNRKFNRILLNQYGTEAPSLPPPGAPPE